MKAKYLIIPLALGAIYAFTAKTIEGKPIATNPPEVKTTPETAPDIIGTWKLLSGTEDVNGVKTVTDYTQNQQMIKIINATHFAFLKHKLVTDKDASNDFDAGGGSYSLKGNQYTEHLDYYSKKNVEGNSFTFTVTINKDTLIQQGVEKLKTGGAEKLIYEKYIKIK